MANTKRAVQKKTELKAARDWLLVEFFEVGQPWVERVTKVLRGLLVEGLVRSTEAGRSQRVRWELTEAGKVAAFETYVEVRSREQLVGKFELAAECADEIIGTIATNASFAIDQRDSKDYQGLDDALHAYADNARVTVIEMGHRSVLTEGFDTFGLFQVFARQEARRLGLSLVGTCCE